MPISHNCQIIAAPILLVFSTCELPAPASFQRRTPVLIRNKPFPIFRSDHSTPLNANPERGLVPPPKVVLLCSFVSFVPLRSAAYCIFVSYAWQVCFIWKCLSIISLEKTSSIFFYGNLHWRKKEDIWSNPQIPLSKSNCVWVRGLWCNLSWGYTFFAASIKCSNSPHNLVLSDFESPPYSDTGLEHRFPTAVSIHPRQDPYELRYRKRSRTVSSVSSVDEDCEDDERDSNGLYVHSPASYSSQGSNWQNEPDTGKQPPLTKAICSYLSISPFNLGFGL